MISACVMAAVACAGFGTTKYGEKAQLYTLTGKGGLKMEVTDYGGRVNRLWVPDASGKLADVTIGFDSPAGWESTSSSIGAIIGRFGNRIADGTFTQDGKVYALAKNDADHHACLHGGVRGWDGYVWDAKPFERGDDVGIVFTRTSPDGEEGFPGTVKAKVTYTITPENVWRIEYEATTDRPTPLNLTQHVYFNMDGEGSILDQKLQIAASKFTPVDRDLKPVGPAAPVEGTPFDFRDFRVIGERIDDPDKVLQYGPGYDHNWVLDGEGFRKVAELRGKARAVEVWTDQVGLQFYAGNFIKDSWRMKDDRPMRRRSYLALETQHFPNTPNRPDFPSTLLKPGETYRTVTEYRFKGPFEPTWESLSRKVTPQWFRDAKFGIWAHYGPQCVMPINSWNARNMYYQCSGTWKYFRDHYGHQSEVGFKDILPHFKAEKWDPERLVRIYKEMGAQYVVAIGNHHDNFDMWDSKYQPWNSVKIGAKRDFLAGWAAACRKEGLPFGISFHADHAYMYYEGAQRSDSDGPRKGVPYDGVMTKADGKGKWWEGLDPQDLYEQRGHKPATAGDPLLIHKYWHWGDGAPRPPDAVMERFYKRTIDALDRYRPDIICFDLTQVPFWPISDVGLKIAAHYYNASAARNGGVSQVVMSGKVLPEDRRQAITWDIERGAPDHILETPWLSSTCIGGWFYNTGIYRANGYKGAAHVIRLLADIVSKNGSLLLSIPLRAEGTFDEKEAVIIDGIGKWMKTNGEAIHGTRPWAVFGEGPSVGKAVKMVFPQGFNEGAMAKGGQGEVRFTRKGDVVYAILLDGRKAERTVLRSFAKGGRLVPGEIASVEWLGGGAAAFTRDAEGLKVERGDVTDASMPAVLKITLAARR